MDVGNGVSLRLYDILNTDFQQTIVIRLTNNVRGKNTVQYSNQYILLQK